jgi:hypothetical protein
MQKKTQALVAGASKPVSDRPASQPPAGVTQAEDAGSPEMTMVANV